MDRSNFTIVFVVEKGEKYEKMVAKQNLYQLIIVEAYKKLDFRSVVV